MHVEIDDLWCHTHMKVEGNLDRTVYHRICFECGHVYKTAEELIAWWNHEHPEATTEPWMDDESEIYFCPLCMHDF